MVLYLDHMCQCELHAVLWSHIGTLMHRLAVDPLSGAGLSFSSRCPSGTILLTTYSMVWDWRVLRAGPTNGFYWPKLLYPYYGLLLLFPFSSFCLWVGIVGLGSLDWLDVYHSLLESEWYWSYDNEWYWSYSSTLVVNLVLTVGSISGEILTCNCVRNWITNSIDDRNQ